MLGSDGWQWPIASSSKRFVGTAVGDSGGVLLLSPVESVERLSV